MKTLLKIMRSIIASLLFAITILALSIQFVFLFPRLETDKLTDMIDRDKLLLTLLDNQKIEETETKKILIDYVDNQINYIFYSRSYPSSQNIDYTHLEAENKEKTRLLIEELKDKLDIEYATILKIRNINNTIMNGSIFLLINITVLVIFLIVSIIKQSFKESLKTFSISLTASGITMLIVGSYIYSNLKQILDSKIYSIVISSIDEKLKHNYIDLTFIYILIGLLLIFIIFYVDKILKKDYKLSTKF